jgi:hypothetical protein
MLAFVVGVLVGLKIPFALFAAHGDGFMFYWKSVGGKELSVNGDGCSRDKRRIFSGKCLHINEQRSGGNECLFTAITHLPLTHHRILLDCIEGFRPGNDEDDESQGCLRGIRIPFQVGIDR